MRKQLDLFTHSKRPDLKKRYTRVAHGGELSKGKRKNERPLSRKHPLHLVLRSEQARGNWSFLAFRNKIMVERLIRKTARRFGVRVQDLANVGNHLHIKLRLDSRKGFQDFLRVITCQIARRITGARRGVKLKKRFWDGLAFTRVVKTWTEVVNLNRYLALNVVQGLRGTKARERMLRQLRKWTLAQAP